MRRLLIRIARIGLYLLLAIVALPIGLRVYSAWQIPKAERLLSEMSRIKIGQPVDQEFQDFLRKSGFTSDTSCKDSTCYQAVIDGVEIANRDELFFLLRHGFFELGLRPWVLLARIRVADQHVVEAGYLLGIADKTPIGISVSVNYSDWHPELRPRPQLFSISESRRFPEQGINVELRPGVADSLIDSSFEPRFACILSLAPCNRAWDLIPQFANLHPKN